ncbi:MAG TPA: serine/threonine-protein kinase, partial [Bryobacteraceae bacterium]|nr:serine/threonine-protein kinase [Bryobacteraceae bacterium]
MTAERWKQVREILYAASEMDTGGREQYLEESCAGDSQLRAEVERLLAALGNSGEFLEPDGAPEDPKPDFKIGPYRILEEAGRGGMGVVYRAARDDDYRQEVALKLVKRDMESGFLIGRFRRERQALALLNHPNIARLLDGGTSPDGRPYLVMEWVSGQSITAYCQAHELMLKDRLELFLKVCDAVAHAHRNLVVHRDLKPSNILITEEGHPKLLDFGIAKIFSPGPDDTQETITMAGARLLTPDYASPEQVRGEPVTTSTDIYSLGAVLYELLTGVRPHRLDTRTPSEIEEVICTKEVARPSAVTEAPATPQQLRGDVDNIILKALEKEPARRYLNVEELGGDIRRYLEGRPVLARPGSFRYRVSKLVRRNKLLTGAAAAVVVALTVGLMAALWEARIAHRERLAAERRFDLARRVAGSLLFEVHDEIADLAGASKARELVLNQSLAYLDALSKEAGSSGALQRDLA